MIGQIFETLFANYLSGYLTVMAAIWIATGIIIFSRRIALRFRGECSDGTIIGHRPRLRAHLAEVRSFVPIVRFSVRGIAQEFQSVTGGRREALPVGTLVRVRYLPSDPKRAEIDDRADFSTGDRSGLSFHRNQRCKIEKLR